MPYQDIAFLAGAFLVGFIIHWIITLLRRVHATKKARDMLQSAQAEAERIKKDTVLASKEETYRLKEISEREIHDARRELKSLERRILKREDVLDRKAEALQRRERHMETQEKNLEQKNLEIANQSRQLQQLLEEEKKTLHNISGMSREEATKLLLARLEQDLQPEMADFVNKIQAQAKETAEVEAKKLIALAAQRGASEHVAEIAVSTVDLPNDEMKGRIIGREGRNIRAFEKATGIDVIVDDTPGVVVISGFDGVRRETARRSMEKLIVDGRIHPGRIEEIVQQTQKEMDNLIQQTGRQVCYDLHIHGLNPKLVTLLGRLKYRTSYGQNVLQHSIDMAHFCSIMASELGLDAQLAKRCGLLHDIGKAVDQEAEGTHPSLGADLARRFGERPEVIDAVERHHEDMKPEFIYTVLTAAADAISASRPGARRETMEKYVKRLKRLESIANAYAGIETSYAIQAGRELRVIVNATKVDDNQATIIARNIANDIEKELKYPGEIRVTIIRETRVIEYAR